MASLSRLRIVRVLVVDDNEPLALVISRVFTTRGLQVDTARSIAEASALERHYTVGVFDIELGDGSGVDLAERMVLANQVERVVFFTGGVAPMQLARAERLGPVFDKGRGVADVADWIEGEVCSPAGTEVG